MSEQKGKMITCSRDNNFVFLKYIGKGEADGGYTTWDEFEPLPKEWMYQSECGYLCPECAKQFKIFVNKFFNGNVCYKWKMEKSEYDNYTQKKARSQNNERQN